MQRVVIDEPYEFVPPVYSDWWPHDPALLPPPLPAHGVRRPFDRMPPRGAAAGVAGGRPQHHARAESLPACPIRWCSASWRWRPTAYLFAMASWHVFKQSWFQTFMIRRMGAFSVLREGNDRQAIDTAIDILVDRKRPLIMFPEGAITRHNDLVEEMMDGPSFIARQAAKRLKKAGQPGEVVIHPVAIRYAFNGDLDKTLSPTLDELETQLSWQPQHQRTLVDANRQESAKPCWRSRKLSFSVPRGRAIRTNAPSTWSSRCSNNWKRSGKSRTRPAA